ncbi:MAG: SDR family NAD(P)-dependent oxidoreductase [Firmicutes bacterium]|nr:SDR family NAD(P)-dependent oxidoreductase [Bacillota bacterium]
MKQILTGKTALITGASSGIGKAIACRFAQEGAAVILTGRRQDRLEAVSQQIRDMGGKCAYLAGDCGIPAFAQELYRFACTFEVPDILVCSAGIALRAPTLEMTLEQWNQVMDVNLTFPMLLSQHCIRGFLEKGSGKIVMISSTAAKNVNMGASPSYGASKAGMVYLTRHFASEFGGRGIYCNAICPGPVDTEITQTWTPEHRQKVLSSLPLGRMGTPDDIANCALFLASGMSDYINGESILVNGGRYMD